MKRMALILICVAYAPSLLARPSFAETLALSHSIVMITTQLPNGQNGRGSGVVVSKEYVATNCHVIANALGANVAKFRDAYQPIAIKADWKRDLCLLKFDDLPFSPVALRDSKTLQYEESVFSLGFPAGQNVPQPSYGEIKAAYPFEDSFIIRSNAAFTMGSSGGALFDEQFNLVGLTTFKSPGSNAYFYHLPVEWIKALMQAPETHNLDTNDIPFWALPLEERPAFMQVVIPYQNEEWAALGKIAAQWAIDEPQSSDAWYYLGVAEEGKGSLAQAKQYLTKAVALNARELDAMNALARIAFVQKDVQTLAELEAPIRLLNNDNADEVVNKIQQLQINE
ncbi:MAG: trypsin-like peptidase domain-containing protein [Methylophilaceae bacterium]|nr:trypsin-like peptidase domain-containing protein [Methylophilaceae bacterium]